MQTSYYSLPPAPTRTDKAVDPSNPPSPPNWRAQRDREPFLESQAWGWFDSATWALRVVAQRAGRRRGPRPRARLRRAELLLAAPRRRPPPGPGARRLNLTADGPLDGPPASTGTARPPWPAGPPPPLPPPRGRHPRRGGPDAPQLRARPAVPAGPAGRRRQRGRRLHGRRLVPDHGRDRPADHQDGQGPWSSCCFRRRRPPTAARCVRGWPPCGPSCTCSWWAISSIRRPAPAAGRRTRDCSTRRCLCAATGTRASLPRSRASRWFPRRRTSAGPSRETFGTVCEVLLAIGFEVEEAWEDSFGKAPPSRPSPPPRGSSRVTGLTGRSRAWRARLEELLAWLGWGKRVHRLQNKCATGTSGATFPCGP